MITPRWEFRTFGHRFAAAEAAFWATTAGAAQESDEVFGLRHGVLVERFGA